MRYVNSRRRCVAGIFALSAITFTFAWPMSANAQWDVIYLNPAGATGSSAGDVEAGQQVGSATVGGIKRASMWTGSASSWLDLHPPGMASSVATGVDGNQQVGYAIDDVGVHHAGLWSGTANSWVDLHPAGADQSLGTGADGGQQVGYSWFGGIPHASLWSGTAESWVDLTPYWAGATDSTASEVDAGEQVGYATVAPGVIHAGRWAGTPESWVDLHPDVAILSAALGVSGGQQVGYTKLGSPAGFHACLWNGTAESWLDLHPPGPNRNSEAVAVDGGQQVGFVYAPDLYRAALWSGTPESYVDLHALLPSKFDSSMAHNIWHDDTYTYVVGYGHNTKRQRNEAIMWRAEYAPPPPGGISVDDIFPFEMLAGTIIDVTITGSDFQSGAIVTFENGSGPQPLADVTYVSPDGLTIDATIAVSGGGPPGARIWDVRVTNPDNSTGVLIGGFTVIK